MNNNKFTHMNKMMLKMATGLDSVKPIKGDLWLEVNNAGHKVTFSEENILTIEGPYTKKVGDALKKLGVDLVLKEKEDAKRVYKVNAQ